MHETPLLDFPLGPASLTGATVTLAFDLHFERWGEERSWRLTLGAVAVPGGLAWTPLHLGTHRDGEDPDGGEPGEDGFWAAWRPGDVTTSLGNGPLPEEFLAIARGFGLRVLDPAEEGSPSVLRFLAGR